MVRFAFTTDGAPRSSTPDELARRTEAWRRFALHLAGGAAAILGSLLTVAYAIDPFDTGRPGLFSKEGVRPQGPRTAGASRGRDPAFNAAVIGNSHVQLLSPERLNALAGLSFVQLSVPATGPKEQFAMIDWFARHHPDARALVIGADNLWCTVDPAMPNAKPFPFWLYSRERLEYGRGLLRHHVLEEIPRRVGYLAASRPARARPDGYWDYEPNYVELGYDRNPVLRERLDRPGHGGGVDNSSGRFPVAERLRDVVAALPPRLAVVLVFPPTYAALLPKPGSPGEAADRACKAALAGVLGAGAAIVDWRAARPETRAADLFFDWTHYRRPIAELVEKEVAAALAQGRANLGR
jgi:hypothetical protein